MEENSKWLQDSIRKAFEKSFENTKPPEGFWEGLLPHLEEKLPEMLQEDQIKESFEVNFEKKTAPAIWDKINSELSEEEPFEDKIKNSFEAHYPQNAPLSFWSKIEESFAENTELQGLEHKVKESFENNFQSRQAPEYVWNALREQINIDAVWTRLSAFLDKNSSQEKRRSILHRSLSYLTLLVLMHACLPTRFLGTGTLSPIQKQEINTSGQPFALENTSGDSKKENLFNGLTEPKESKKENAPTTNVLEEKQDLISKKSGENAKWANSNNSPKAIGSKQQDLKLSNNSISNDKTILAVVDNNSNQNVTDINSNNSKNTVEPKQQDPKQPNNNNTAIDKPIDANNNPAIAVVIDNGSEQPNKETPKDTLQEQNQALQDVVASLILQNDTLAHLFPALFAMKEKVVVAENMPENIQKQKSREKRWELGGIASFGVGGMNNTETKVASKSNSLLDLKTLPATSLGVLGIYHLNDKNAISLEVDFNNQIRHHINFFSSGGYYSCKEEILNYSQIGLSYQRKVAAYQLGKVRSEFLLRTGFYASYLRDNNTFLNDNATRSSNFKKVDFGLKGMLGQAHQFGNIRWEYGIATVVGVYDIFSGTSAITSVSVNRTNIYSLGLFTSLRYRF